MTLLKTIPNYIIFIAFCILLVLFTFAFNNTIITDNLYFSFFSNQIAYERIEEIIAQKQKLAWLGYVFVPVIFLLKFTVISLIILTGFFFFEKKVSFLFVFKAVMLAEIPFLFIPLIKSIWFMFIQTKYSLEDVSYFFPLSVLQLFNIKSLSSWQIYPLQLFNVFELIYWVLLAFWLKIFLNISINKSMEVVVSSYGTGLLLWVVFITFLTLSLT